MGSSERTVAELLELDDAAIESIRVLSVQEPWASLIASRRKGVENREEQSSVWKVARRLEGQVVLIHASQKLDRHAYARAAAPDGLPWPNPPLRGRIMCAARVGKVLAPHEVGVHGAFRALGQYGVELRDQLECTVPITVSGALGFWYLKRADESAWRKVQQWMQSR